MAKGNMVTGDVEALPARHIAEETCAKWDYRIGKEGARWFQIANYKDETGTIVGQKLRTPDKKFEVRGTLPPLYGEWLWRDGGNKIVITEGEIDALSVSQAQGNKWPVVSLANGAASAEKAIRKSIEWLEKFDEVILMFDQDDAGRSAVEACAPLFTPGKCKVAKLPLKDANEMLVAGRTKELIDAIWGAKVYRPDGVIDASDITVQYLLEAPVPGYTTSYTGLDSLLGGVRKGELTLFTAGTGSGKSTAAREIAWHLMTHHRLKVGNMYLEESYRKTAQGYVAIDHEVPLGKLRANPTLLTPEQYQRTLNALKDRAYFYSHFGSLDSDVLLSKLNYFAVGLQCDFIILDHISIVISGQESSGEGERKDIDRLMTRLRTLVERTGVGVLAISHLRKSDGGKSHEEGGRVTLDDLRGSGGLKQLTDNVVAIERDQQGDEPNEAVIRVLKNREHGDTGPCSRISYDKETGRLTEIENLVCPFEDQTESSNNNPVKEAF